MKDIAFPALLVFLIIGISFGCISGEHSSPTSTVKNIQTSETMQTANLSYTYYKDWLHNSTKYFEIYYPEEIYENPTLQSKLNMLLLGADSTYESYSKLFGIKPQRAKIYLYPSKDSLKSITGKNTLWFVDYRNREIHIALIEESGMYSSFEIVSALLEFAAGRKLPDVIAVGFGVLNFRISMSPQEKAAKYVSIEQLKSLDLRKEYNETLYAEAGDLLRYIADIHGTQALIKTLKGGNIPTVNEKDFLEFLEVEDHETSNIEKTIITLNISIEQKKFEGAITYNNVTSQPYIYFRRTPRINIKGIKVNGKSVDFIQSFTIVIPMKNFKKGSIEIKYSGDYSKIEKIAPKRGYIEGQIKKNTAFLRGAFLRPMLNSVELFNVIEVRAKTDRGIVIAPGELISSNVWRISFPNGFTGVIPVFAGEFKKMELMNGYLTVYYMGLDDKTAEGYANLTAEILEFGVEHFGKPGYGKVKVVYPKEISISSLMLDTLAYSHNPLRYKYGYTYEVAHWWVPGTVTFDRNMSQFWFNLAFPWYYSLKYAQNISQESYRELRNYGISKYHRATKYGEKDVPLTEVWKVWRTDINLYYAVGAYKGALVLEKLEEYTGREAFFQSLREFFEKYRLREGNLNDFVAILEKNSGKPVKELFQNLTANTGLP
ncbi:M1 family aminopeptidase [Thermococcus barophilus]|nr:M1 family aminopeptidase [Thermococcus barophilus]